MKVCLIIQIYFFLMIVGRLIKWLNNTKIFSITKKDEKPKISYLLEKTLVLSIICSKCENEEEQIFKEEESMERLQILNLIENI